MQTDELAKVCEMARMLGVTPSTVRKMVKAGRLPVLRLSTRTLRFDTGEVLRSLKKNRGEKPESRS